MNGAEPPPVVSVRDHNAIPPSGIWITLEGSNLGQSARNRSGRLRRSTQTAVLFSSDGEEVRYPARLRWVCVRCANSCRDIPPRKRNILLTPSDVERITRATKLRAEEFSETSVSHRPYERKMKKLGGSCMFLQGSRCSIYQARPLICRFYPFCLHPSEDGGLEVRFDRACSGIGKGSIRSKMFFHKLVRLARRELRT